IMEEAIKNRAQNGPQRLPGQFRRALGNELIDDVRLAGFLRPARAAAGKRVREGGWRRPKIHTLPRFFRHIRRNPSRLDDIGKTAGFGRSSEAPAISSRDAPNPARWPDAGVR